MAIFSDFGIDFPLGATGECRTTCPQCSASRRKQHDRCLVVNASEGLWHCWHCGWRGSMKQQSGQRPSVPMMHQPPCTPDARRQEAIERRWQEAAPLAAGDPVFWYLWSRGLVLPLRDRTAEQPSSRLFLQYTGVLHHFEAPHNVSRVQQRPHTSHTTLLAHILLQGDYWHKKTLEGATSRVSPAIASNYRTHSE